MAIAPTAISNVPGEMSLEDWLRHPPDNTEWVDGRIVEKLDMTLKHGDIQGNLYFLWRTYMTSSGKGGKVYTDVPCRTEGRGRKPDVAYLTPELLAQFGDLDVLPQSFPLIAEIVSPTDLAEEVIAKSQEYLRSGCEEVWLVFPENRWILVVTQNQQRVFVSGEVITTQVVLQGFRAPVDEILHLTES